MKFENVLTLIGIFGGWCIGMAMGMTWIMDQAIDHNAAHYDPKTASFTWNLPLEK